MARSHGPRHSRRRRGLPAQRPCLSRATGDFARVGRVRDAAGQHYALRFSTSLDNIRHRHHHDLVRLLEHLVGADAQILAAVEGLASLNQAQSATRDTLRQ